MNNFSTCRVASKSVVVLSQELKLLCTKHFSFLHLGRHLEHLELIPEAELSFEIFEVAVEHPLATVEQAAKDLGPLISKGISWNRSHFVPDHPEREFELRLHLSIS